LEADGWAQKYWAWSAAVIAASGDAVACIYLQLSYRHGSEIRRRFQVHGGSVAVAVVAVEA
jgi:hypothetical protein